MDKLLMELNGIKEEDTLPKDRIGDVENVADMAYVNSEIALAMIDLLAEGDE